MTAAQYYKALNFAKEGRYSIIYVAPERLETDGVLDFALHSPIAMVAVGEAHCVSQRGQNVRPSRLKIVEFIKKLPRRPVVSASTATATRTTLSMAGVRLWWRPTPSEWDITKTTIKMTDTRIIKIDKLAIMYNKKG